MSLVSFIGPRPNLFDLEGRVKRKRLEVRQPILTNEDLEKIRAIGDIDGQPVPDARPSTSPIRPTKGAEGMERGARAAVRRAPRSPSTAATTSSSCPTAWSAPDRIADSGAARHRRPSTIT